MKPFEKLKNLFQRSDFTVALPSSPFVMIDREKAIERLKLDEKAASNGEANFPPTDSKSLDDVEAEIVAEIGDYAKRAQINALTNHRVYGERLSELALLRELSTVSGESHKAIGDYRAIIINSKGRLGLARDAIKESYDELAEFKSEHGLRRPAHRGIHPAYAWSTIGISWFVESAFNTAFLRVNDEFGLLGGFIAAAVVAAVNIFFSALVGRLVIPYVFYKYTMPKILALIGATMWLALLLVWNLLAGHFRDAKAAGIPAPENASLSLFLDSPFQFDSIYSYGLLAAGFAFAILAAIAAFKMNDPYPGYGDIYGRHEARCEDYADEIEQAMDELRETRDEAVDLAQELRDELGVQFRERGQIIAARETHRNQFDDHQTFLENTANTLLSYYRSANIRARSDQAPEHFNATWKLDRSQLPMVTDEPIIDDEVTRAQKTLEEAIVKITDAYGEAIESFEHLDHIKGSLVDG